MYPPVCSTAPASLQAKAISQGTAIRAWVEQEGRAIFYIGKEFNFILSHLFFHIQHLIPISVTWVNLFN